MTVSSIAPMLPVLSAKPDRVSNAPGKASPSVAQGDFSALVDRLADTTPGRADAPGTIRPLVAHEARAVPPLEQFEGFVLRSFVETMLPSTDSGFFGEGTAGQMWRSMLAEHIGNELAKDGGIGIAASITGKDNASGGAGPSSSEASAAEALRKAPQPLADEGRLAPLQQGPIS